MQSWRKQWCEIHLTFKYGDYTLCVCQSVLQHKSCWFLSDLYIQSLYCMMKILFYMCHFHEVKQIREWWRSPKESCCGWRIMTSCPLVLDEFRCRFMGLKNPICCTYRQQQYPFQICKWDTQLNMHTNKHLNMYLDGFLPHVMDTKWC